MKIAFTGPESTGKSTISTAVAEYFQAEWFREYARPYLMERNGEYQFENIEDIAVKQEHERSLSSENGIGIYDTENSVLYIWSIFKYGKCSPVVEELMNHQQFDHYFLCSPDGIPWEDDPLREHPNQREELFEIYLETLKRLNVEYTILMGTEQNRTEKAIELIEELTLSKGGFCF